MAESNNNTHAQQQAWREALNRKQARDKFPAQAGRPNPGATQAHNKAAGRKDGIRRQGSKRG